VLTFGRPTYGRLGRGQTVDTQSDEPYEVPTAVEGLDGPAVSVEAGVSVTAAVTASGAVYVWGYGDTCQLGKPGGDESDELSPMRMKPNKYFSGNTAKQVAFGGQHACMIARD